MNFLSNGYMVSIDKDQVTIAAHDVLAKYTKHFVTYGPRVFQHDWDTFKKEVLNRFQVILPKNKPCL